MHTTETVKKVDHYQHVQLSRWPRGNVSRIQLVEHQDRTHIGSSGLMVDRSPRKRNGPGLDSISCHHTTNVMKMVADYSC